MKANEALEKIYISLIPSISGGHVYTTVNKDFPNAIEYTRTDAFMKKTENFLEMLGYGFTITDNITHVNYDKEQLIADFRKYVEG